MRGRISGFLFLCCALAFGLLTTTSQNERLSTRQLLTAAQDILDSLLAGLCRRSYGG
jgi:hypothetical protein